MIMVIFFANEFGSVSVKRSGDLVLLSLSLTVSQLSAAHTTELDWTLSFSFASGIAAGGTTNLKFFSNGEVEFTGNFHDSGLISYDYSVACVFVDAERAPYR
jgi:hypothetical protein